MTRVVNWEEDLAPTSEMVKKGLVKGLEDADELQDSLDRERDGLPATDDEAVDPATVKPLRGGPCPECGGLTTQNREHQDGCKVSRKGTQLGPHGRKNKTPGTATEPVKATKKAGKVPTKTDLTAKQLGLDLSSECPVCRELGKCECDEEDRAFVRRVRFEATTKSVARCEKCSAPLSVVYVRRPGVDLLPPYKLPQFAAVYSCAGCAGDALAAVALSQHIPF